MNRNGFERNGMTGSSTTTSENLTWLASASQAAAQAAAAHQRPPGGAMLPPTTIAAGGHDPHFQLPAAAPAGLEALYRSGLTVTDPSSRLFVSGQYSSVYTTTGTTLSPYTQSLYSGHGSQPLSPYAAAYMYQWPSAYSPGAGPLLPGQYPHIESFSAVLQNLGSQHAQHSHLPRLPYVRPHIPHSPYPGAGSLTTTTDSLRVPAIVHRSALRMGAPAIMEPPSAPRKSPKRDQKGSFRSGDVATRHSPHDRKSPAIRRYSPLPATQYRHPHHSPPAAVRDTVYRDADARHADPNSARKHRILTQSPQMGSEPLSAAMYSQAGNTGAGMMAPPLLQRSRGNGATMAASSVGQPPPLLPSHSSSTGLPQTGQGQSSHLPPLPPLHPAQTSLPYPADPHYPAHFMKGSIIQLANGELKRVEELRTDDFISSADVSADLKIDSSTVVRMEENTQRGTAILGFSVGTQRIQVGGTTVQSNIFPSRHSATAINTLFLHIPNCFVCPCTFVH
ncbi:hypothetical protein NP493_689g01011 [Ridgeia piscesae]|uniref:AXH domain-containing protein n=1 Tax=Ridgeia piscesae TaxID=27915 RepID=A0AAD9NN16_RIDPI|nr:hypothetical protein NP493_689g01011 [Ridgeia piscesae]